MAGADKGLVEVAGKPMVAHILEVLRPQVGRVIINANRNGDRYALFDVPTVGDGLTDFQGPLAGMASGMAAAETELLLTVPCDSPLIPNDLASRMIDALDAAEADVAVAHDGRRLQPVFALLRTTLLDDLNAYLASGERKIDLWFQRQRFVEVNFSDCPDAFLNVNTPTDRIALEIRLRQTTSPRC